MTDPSRREAELNTWQEIADHLGVSKREAQNWEKNDGMPIHRMPGKKSRVKAYPAELDAWMARVATTRNIAPAVLPGSPAPTPDSPDHRLSRRGLLGGVATVAAVSAGGAWFLRRRGATPARAGVVGNALCTWDESGREIWRYLFPKPLRDRKNHNGMLHVLSRQTQIADLQGSDAMQVLFAAGFMQEADEPVLDELYCFSAEGKLLWRYRPQLTVTFGNEHFSGPWCLSDMAVAPAGRRKTIWLSLEHWNWRPGAVLTLDPAGNATVKFVNSGHIYVLSRASTGGRDCVLAGGVNNEYACAALAVLREDAAPSCSPQTRGTRFECLDGPRGQPERYFLFPPSDITSASGRPYNLATGIDHVNQEFIVSTREVPGEQDGAAMYRFSAQIEPVDVTFDDTWAASHRRFQTEGRIGHGLRDCPYLRRPTLVRRWDPSGWRTLSVPPSFSRKPDASQS